MQVYRTKTTEAKKFILGDRIEFAYGDYETVGAVAVKHVKGNMLFVAIDCLGENHPMYEEADEVCDGYENSDLRKYLNETVVERFPEEIKGRLVPFHDGDLLTIPTEEQISGASYYGYAVNPQTKQFRVMTKRRNLVAYYGYNGTSPARYWLKNRRRMLSGFICVDSDGKLDFARVSSNLGIRLVFMLKNT